MKINLGLAEKVFTVVSLLHYTGGPLVVILSGGASEGDGESATADFALVQLLFLLNYAVTFVLLVARWKKVAYVLSKDRFIGVLIAIALASIFWSYAPSTTTTRNIALVGTTLFGLYLATRYTLKEQLKLLGWTFGIAIFLSLAFAVALPKYGLMSGIHAGKWRGIYAHKNVLGKLMILSGLIFLLLAIGARKNKYIIWGGFVFSIILIVLSKSSSSLVNFFILIGAFFILRTLRWRYDLMVPALIALITVGGSISVWFTANADVVLGAMGKDATLTGRGDMWPFVLDMIWKRPWLGYGFSGFWLGWDSECAYVWRATRWMPPNSHNGLLDLWLDLGLLGLSTYLVGFVINFVKGIAWLRLSRTPDSFWPVIYILYFLLSNMSESALLRQNEIYWVLYVTVVLSMLIPPEETKEVVQANTSNNYLNKVDKGAIQKL